MNGAIAEWSIFVFVVDLMIHVHEPCQGKTNSVGLTIMAQTTLLSICYSSDLYNIRSYIVHWLQI